MTTQNFLVEIGTEELPPKALKTLATSLAKRGQGRFGRNDNEENNQIGHEFLNLHAL